MNGAGRNADHSDHGDGHDQQQHHGCTAQCQTSSLRGERVKHGSPDPQLHNDAGVVRWPEAGDRISIPQFVPADFGSAGRDLVRRCRPSQYEVDAPGEMRGCVVGELG
jgi:hypothetical protein